MSLINVVKARPARAGNLRLRYRARGLMPGLMLAAWLSAAVIPVRAAVTFVADSQARSVVVTGDAPNPRTVLAAGELVNHLRQATGVELEVVREAEAPDKNTVSRIFIGPTRAAESLGIDSEELEPDAFILRTDGNDLYILGKEDDSEYHHRQGGTDGTLYGVYEVLHRYVGIRWLWPGETGTYVPDQSTVRIDEPLAENNPIAFRFRRFRKHGIRSPAASAARGEYTPPVEGLYFSGPVLEAYDADLLEFLRRHRLGYTEPKPTVGHHFAGWWERYGEEHPEWFMLNSEGERGPEPGRSTRHVAVCVSSPDLHRYIVEEHWDGGDVLSLGEVDVRVFCQCSECLAWDGPQPDDYPPEVRSDYRPQMVSDRYARFWKTIQEMARDRNPNVTVTTFLYWNYLPAPTGEIELNRNIYGEFVPWTGRSSYFPQEDELYGWLREQWQGWYDRGMTLAYRPNIFHCMYTMPHISTWQAGDFFKFAWERGMVGFDFCGKPRHWSAQGPMLYMYHRLGWDPEAEIDTIREEYFSAFGPAAAEVERYFDYWEDYSLTRPYARAHLYNPVTAHIDYPPEVFPPAEAMLAQALEQARQADRDDYAERVEFLRIGLEHARLSARLMGATDYGTVRTDSPAAFLSAQEKLRELLAFRRRYEHTYMADLQSIARHETRRVDIDTLLRDAAEVLGEDAADWQEIELEWGQWKFRKDPEGAGLSEGWHGETPDNDWKAIEVPAFWRDTWAEDYLGYGWYRTEFKTPEISKEKMLVLNFSGVDEQAWVYVNGRYASEQSVASEGEPAGALWDRPFTVEIPPEQLNSGAENVLTVMVHAARNNGGIFRPVSAYLRRTQ